MTRHPALGPDEWEYFESGGIRKHAVSDAVTAVEHGLPRDRPYDVTPHALAAILLRDPEFGITPTDAYLVRSAASLFHKDSAFVGDRLRDLADRLEALMPPAKAPVARQQQPRAPWPPG